ncbi:5-methylcytosine-specific restriction endonuclease McrBC, GTP-binding regulatory subunit McrB [Chitinophaga rupis]|uniref:5-methylcytosine-specific restriction endonuclease McrBC, GTP-binding regulatory subunit McrB n=1 Tax=Chitinophaga rupis TaxID=573321 RepID=A0A1H8KQV9_9BACT|nr:DUF3578 domain-containing protein [Chitinophaga rupis]SEN94996.1 5-methylcytosine-specific restriction endonuclease McrBC, GTP-binding regulatory subunit McrB [Chitinophaga rupis]
MAIPKNINKEHLLAAIDKIDKDGIPLNASSKSYDVFYKGNRYPPKLVVSYANLFANGSILDRDTFEGGIDTECFNLLEQNGFLILKKNAFDFSPILLKFLNQAQETTPNLKTGDYAGTYGGCRIEAGFGKGNAARIPWLALLRENQKVSKGIYPVYLYYKRYNILILAFGVSETHKPDIPWNRNDQTIKEYFQEKFSAKPDRYGSSGIYRVYDIDPNQEDFGLNLTLVNNDIASFTDYYNRLDLSIEQQPTNVNPMAKEKTSPKPQRIAFNYEQFIKALKAAHLNFSNIHVQRLIGSLCTKPFVILTGLSGSGKTKLAQAFAHWLCKDKTEQVCIVPVGADWTNREPLLGFPNALEKQNYIFPDNGALSLILRAIKDPNQPYFLILDEMNLSHVERYFADFLSAMESGADICLHPGETDWESNHGLKAPPSISLPPNLFIIGTVNIDETTYMFSPKVLDRANVIEFRVSRKEMEDYFKSANSGVNLGNLDAAGEAMGSDFVEIAKRSMPTGVDQAVYKVLLAFFDVLKKVGAEFGYRSAAEIIRFIAIVKVMMQDWTNNKIIDIVVMQKLLTKLHGSRRKLEEPLEELGKLCVQGKKDDKEEDEMEKKILVKDLLLPTTQIADNDERIKYPISFNKIKRMHQRLMENSFTSYAEA